MGREVGITQAEFAELLDGVRTAIGKWPRFAKAADVPKDLMTAAASWHTRTGESVK